MKAILSMMLVSAFVLVLLPVKQIFASGNGGPNEGAASEMKIFPIPASSVLVVLFQNDQEQIVDLKIADRLGNEMFAGCKLAIAGSGQFDIDVSLFPDGVYYLELKKGVITERNQFTVLR